MAFCAPAGAAESAARPIVAKPNETHARIARLSIKQGLGKPGGATTTAPHNEASKHHSALIGIE
jgi:hypothetical protein